MIVLTAIGVCLAGYLTYVHYSGITPPCSTTGNPCAAVQKSQYSLFIGIPVALIGLLGYIAILGSLLVRETETSRLVTLMLALPGWGFSMYLTYREIFTLHKICEWCVSSAVLLTVITALSIWRFLRGDVGTAANPAAADGQGGAQDAATPLGSVSS